MKILALEFSSSQRSVAVVCPPLGGEFSSKRSERVATQSSDVLVSEIVEAASGGTMKPLSMVEEALKQARLEREQIECVAVGLGPGSYTGVRVAIALAQGWQLARGVKLLGISSAESVAATARTKITGECCVVIDAQREELYLARYEFNQGGLRELQPLTLVTLAEARGCKQAGAMMVGPEVTRWFPEGRTVFPSAAMLGKLALGRSDFVSGERLAPLYLRETNFVKSLPPRVVS